MASARNRPGGSPSRMRPIAPASSSDLPQGPGAPIDPRIPRLANDRNLRGSRRVQQAVPVLEVGIEDSFAEGFEPIDVLDGLECGDGRGIGLTEPPGPLTK